nr:MAG TPA: hypothetical protein [Caudoviricetes sp.]
MMIIRHLMHSVLRVCSGCQVIKKRACGCSLLINEQTGFNCQRKFRHDRETA